MVIQWKRQPKPKASREKKTCSLHHKTQGRLHCERLEEERSRLINNMETLLLFEVENLACKQQNRLLARFSFKSQFLLLVRRRFFHDRSVVGCITESMYSRVPCSRDLHICGRLAAISCPRVSCAIMTNLLMNDTFPWE